MQLPRLPLKSLTINVTAILILILASMYTAQAIKHQPQSDSPQVIPVQPTVSVVEVYEQLHNPQLLGHGEAKSHYSLNLSSEIIGRVISVTKLLQPGVQIKRGEVLAHIDRTNYLQAVALSEQTLAQAKLALLLEQREAELARHDRKTVEPNKQPTSTLALRLPQLTAAQAAIKQAQAALDQALRDLKNTKITAPFDAIVVTRHISPGEYLQTGDPIATLYSSDRIDIRISLPLQQWRLLPSANELTGQAIVKLTDNQGQEWQGYISSVEQHIDPNIRQKSLVVSVEAPLDQPFPLLAGTFLTALISSPINFNLAAIPASSLTSAGQVWYITNENTLSHFEAKIIFQQKGTLFIEIPNIRKDSDFLQVLTTPLPSYVVGQAVNAKVVKHGAQR